MKPLGFKTPGFKTPGSKVKRREKPVEQKGRKAVNKNALHVSERDAQGDDLVFPDEYGV